MVVTPVLPDHNFDHRPTQAELRDLRLGGPIGKLHLRFPDQFGTRLAREIAALPSVEWLWIWCDATRAGIREILLTPGLRTLDVLSMQTPGRLSGFDRSPSLVTFRCNHYMTEADLFAIARCSTLRTLGAQGARISPATLDVLLAMPALETLDLENSTLDDRMAKRLARATGLRSLDVGASRLTGTGFRHLCRMRELRALDAWGLTLSDEDLQSLFALDRLEYLSLGHPNPMRRPDPDRLVDLLLDHPSLRRVWLDGISLQPEQVAALEARFEQVRVAEE